MEDDNQYLLCFLFLLVVILSSVCLGTYRYGRFVERRTLTQYFVQATVDTYHEGYNDGLKDGKRIGLKTGLKECDDVLIKENSDGRY